MEILFYRTKGATNKSKVGKTAAPAKHHKAPRVLFSVKHKNGKVSSVTTKAGPGRPRKKRDGAARTPATKKDSYAYYQANRAKILKKAKLWYQKHKAHKKLYVKKWRKRTSGGKNPLYLQNKPSGKRPIHARLPRVNGKGPKRDADTGKKPQTTRSGRAAVEKVIRKSDEKREEAKRKGPGRPKKVAAPVKRGRGRPKKVAAPVKRGRGRPKMMGAKTAKVMKAPKKAPRIGSVLNAMHDRKKVPTIKAKKIVPVKKAKKASRRPMT